MKPILHTAIHRFNNTGVVGINFWRGSHWNAARRHNYFVVSRGTRLGRRRFNIDTLGKEEAWRRAVRCRAEFETAQRIAINNFSAQRGNLAPGSGQNKQKYTHHA